jgi:putative addiction module component (TIGR02574 family)
MASTRDELVTAALALPPEERESIAHALLDSLDAEELSPGEWEHAWTEEIRRRLADVRAGQAELSDADEVLRQAHADLDSRLR